MDPKDPNAFACLQGGSRVCVNKACLNHVRNQDRLRHPGPRAFDIPFALRRRNTNVNRSSRSKSLTRIRGIKLALARLRFWRIDCDQNVSNLGQDMLLCANDHFLTHSGMLKRTRMLVTAMGAFNNVSYF